MTHTAGATAGAALMNYRLLVRLRSNAHLIAGATALAARSTSLNLSNTGLTKRGLLLSLGNSWPKS